MVSPTASSSGFARSCGEHGAKLQVVKNTLTRRAAEAAGTESLLALLEGPSAIAFVETDGDPVAVAKALSDVAKETKILTLRGGVLSGKTMTGDDVEELAKLPPVDVIKSQLVGVIIAPLTQLLALIQAPVQDLVGLIDARITQLGEDAPAEAEAPASDRGRGSRRGGTGRGGRCRRAGSRRGSGRGAGSRGERGSKREPEVDELSRARQPRQQSRRQRRTSLKPKRQTTPKPNRRYRKRHWRVCDADAPT